MSTKHRHLSELTCVVAGVLLVAALAACSSHSSAGQGGGSSPGGDLLTYAGNDRQSKLEAQAKSEGQLVVYTSNTATQAAAKEFGKLHPDIKVTTYLGKATDLLTRLKAEYSANKVGGDLLGMANTDMPQAQAAGYLAEYYSPSVNQQPADTLKAGAKKGDVYYAADREDYTVMGWNTKLITKAEAPKTLDDLLDPKWKGKITISGHTTGINWLGVVVDAKGADFVDKLKAQNIRVQDVTAAALADLVASGEVPLSPNLGLSDVIKLKTHGDPLDWVAIPPAPAAGGSDGVIGKAKHPAAALMFIDYLHSADGQKFMVGQGVLSPRTDVTTPGLGDVNFPSEDLSTKYSVDEYAQKYTEWQALMQKAFVS
ncbi:MAG TPA: extracellular solute-binding protein [Jatrophihabitantaceae bacterium]|jgi:iron(III) transport system substrate-binding protein